MTIYIAHIAAGFFIMITGILGVAEYLKEQSKDKIYKDFQVRTPQVLTANTLDDKEIVLRQEDKTKITVRVYRAVLEFEGKKQAPVAKLREVSTDVQYLGNDK